MMSALFSDAGMSLKITALFSLPLLIISSCYMLKFLHKSFFGEEQEIFAKINDISVHEFVVLASITAGLVIFGLFPSAVISLTGVN